MAALFLVGVAVRAGSLPTISIVTYNLGGGNFDDTAANWSTNSAAIQAAGSILKGLQPDIVGIQEYSVANTWQITNLIKTYRPGFFAATNSTTAGGPRNVILSRFPITRSQSWLARTSLKPFGFNGAFTRDLFEAQLAVPGFSRPLHVFDVHLKAFNDSTNGPRRAAEARCISNWLVTVYLVGSSKDDPYVLMGDMNEDIFKPRQYEHNAIGTLLSGPTGLHLITPLNPITLTEKTWSSTAPPSIRFDYFLPCGFLFSNFIPSSSMVFRSDLYNAQHPLPAGISANATGLATDHLPVLAVFAIPDIPPLPRMSIAQSVSTLKLSWSTNAVGASVESTLQLVPPNWQSYPLPTKTIGDKKVVELPMSNSQRFFRLVQ